MHRFCCACLRKQQPGDQEILFDQTNLGTWPVTSEREAPHRPSGALTERQRYRRQGGGEHLPPLGTAFRGGSAVPTAASTPRREPPINEEGRADSSDRMQVLSAVKEKDVEYLDRTPSDDEDIITHPFECPICFRFSDHILRTHCCRQYMCHMCATQLKIGFIRSCCPHCRTQPLILVDPTPSSPVRCYRDSPTKISRKIEWMNVATTAVAREGRGPAKRRMPEQEVHSYRRAHAGGA